MTLFSLKKSISVLWNRIHFPAGFIHSFKFQKSFNLCLVLIVVVTGQIKATTYTATKSGNWNDISVWGGVGYPHAADNAVIDQNYTIPLTVDAACTNLIFGGNAGILALGTSNLSISGNLTFICSAGKFTATTGYIILNGTSQTINMCTGGGNSIPNLRLSNSTAVSMIPQTSLTITGNFDCQTGSSTFSNSIASYQTGTLLITGKCTAPNCIFIIANDHIGPALDFSGSTSDPVQVGTVILNFTYSNITFGTKNVVTTTAFSGTNKAGITATGTVKVLASLKQFKSYQAGSWATKATWQQSVDGGVNWTKPATTIPTNADGVVTVQHAITVGTANASAYNLIVTAAGSIVISGIYSLKPVNATIYGTVTGKGTNTSAFDGGSGVTSTISFAGGSTFIHNQNGNRITQANWDLNSTCIVNGVTSGTPYGTDQTFGNFTWDCSLQNADLEPNYIPIAILGTLKIVNTNSHYFGFPKDITIGTDLNITGGKYRLTNSASRTLTVNGNVLITGGTLALNTDATNYTGTLNVAGNFGYTAGTVSSAGGAGYLIFNGTTQTFTSGGTLTGPVNVTINNAASVQMITATTINGNLLISAGGTLNTAGFPLTLIKDFNNSGTFNASTSNINFSGTNSQNIAGFATTGTVSMLKTGGTATLSGNINASGLTINGTAGILNLGSGLTHTINTLVIFTSGTLNGNSSILNINGTINSTGGTWGAGTSTVNYGCIATQSVLGGTSYYNLILSGGGAKTMQGAAIVSNVLTLTSGILTTSSTNPLTISNTATTAISGGNANSFINGPVTWSLPTGLVTGTTYNYPVGKGTTYLPFSLVNPTTSTATTAQIEAFSVAPTGGTPDGLTLSSISNSEYWKLATTGTFTSASVSLGKTGAISPLNAIGGSITLGGAYSSLNGTVGATAITGSNAIGANRFFVLGSLLPCSYGSNTLTGTTITPVIDMPGNVQTNPTTFTTGKYFVMNVIKGLIYQVYTSSSPAQALKMTLYQEGIPAGPILATSYSNTGNPGSSNVNDVYLTFTSPLSGQVRILINSQLNCGSTSVSGLTLNTNVSAGGNALDDSNAQGVNTWIGQIYDGVSFNNYLGYYNVPGLSGNPDTFQEAFGTVGTWPSNTGDDVLGFNVNSNNSVLAQVKIVTFSVHYRMKSTKRGFYRVDATSDDGAILNVDGIPVCNFWSDHGPQTNANMLLSLSGNSSLALDYYENNGQNIIGFYNLVQIFSNTLTNTNQNICLGSSGNAISGDVFGALPLPTGITGTGYQWYYSTSSDPNVRIVIPNATAATYTPNSSATPFNVAGIYYLYRVATMHSTLNVNPISFDATNESNAATITVNNLNSIVLSSAVGTNVQTMCLNTAITNIAYITTGATGATISGLPSGLTGNWASNGVTISGTSTASGIFNYTVTLTGGCSNGTANGTITVNPLLPVSILISASSNPACSGASVTYTAATTNGGTSASFQWKVNGLNVGTGSTYSYIPANNDAVTCILTSNATPCTTGNPAISNALTMNVNPVIGNNTINFASYSTPIYSGNSPGTTTSSLPTGGNGSYSYLWQSSTTGITGSFTACSGANTAKEYIPGVLLQTTWYTRTVRSGGCNDISTAIQIIVLPVVPPDLKSSSAFAVFTGNGAITISGTTVIHGNLGTNAGAFTGLGFATITGTTHIADTYTLQATTDLTTANGYLNTLGGKVLATLGGGQVLTPGIYYSSAITINGDLTIDALGDPNAVFIIRTGGALSTGAGTTIKLMNSANMSNVYWQINGAFALAAGSTFTGNSIITGAVALSAGSVVTGNVLTTAGAITIVGSTINPDGLLNRYILIENNVISPAQSIRNNTIPTTLTGTLPLGSSEFIYSWESSITNAVNGFSSIITNGSSQNYSPGALSQSTWYRRKVSSGIYSNTSEAIKITVLAVTPSIIPPNLGTASSFSLFTINGNISNTGNSIIIGNTGTDKGTISGFPPGTIIGGSLHSKDANTSQAAADLLKANTYLNTFSVWQVLDVTLGGTVKLLTPGVYNTLAATTINGNLTLDAQGDPNAVFIIIIGGALSIGNISATTITTVNSADLSNVYWLVKGAFSMDNSSVFRGSAIVDGAISLMSGSSVLGNALSLGVGGAVTIDNNFISNDNLMNRFIAKGNWSDPTKWSQNVLSTSTENIIISAAVIVDGDYSNKDLTIDLNGSVTVLPGKSLTLSGNITNTAGPSGLIIKADPALANGSLIFHNPSTTPVNATVEMYSKASWNLNSTVPAGGKYKWQFFGIPFKSLKASPAFDGAYVRRLNEKGDSIHHWLQLSNDSILTKFTGYEITQSDPKTYSLSGELINEDYSISLPYTSGAFRPGQYLFCNPYTAAIDLSNPSKILFGDNTEKSVYLYNTGSYNDWQSSQGATSIGDGAGQYSVSPSQLGGAGLIPGQVPSMQGFLIKATGPAGLSGSVTIPYSALIKNTDKQRAPSIIKTGSSDKVFTRIDIKGSRFTDRTWIFSDPKCTPLFDNGWDGYKMKGAILAPQLYVIGADGDYQVNAVADMNDTQLGFQAGEDSEYTLTFTNENIQTLYSAVFLIDLVENKTLDITTNGSIYLFASAPTPVPVKRFKIFTLPVEKEIPDTTLQIKLFTSGNTVFVQNSSNTNGELIIYDMMGRTLKKETFGPDGVTAIQAGTLPGVYIVKAAIDSESVSEKIILVKEK